MSLCMRQRCEKTNVIIIIIIIISIIIISVNIITLFSAALYQPDGVQAHIRCACHIRLIVVIFVRFTLTSRLRACCETAIWKAVVKYLIVVTCVKSTFSADQRIV